MCGIDLESTGCFASSLTGYMFPKLKTNPPTSIRHVDKEATTPSNNETNIPA